MKSGDEIGERSKDKTASPSGCWKDSPQRFLKCEEGGFQFEADFWRELLHVSSPDLQEVLAFGAGLASMSGGKFKVRVYVAQSTGLNGKTYAEMVKSLKRALDKRGYLADIQDFGQR